MEDQYTEWPVFFTPKQTYFLMLQYKILLFVLSMLYGNGFREIQHHAFNGTKLDQV